MTPEEINIAIAEVCGWKDIHVCTCSEGKSRGVIPGGGGFKHIPDYYNDSLIDVWKITIDGVSCYSETEEDARETAGEEFIESGEAVITKEKMHREVLDNLPDFNGF